MNGLTTEGKFTGKVTVTLKLVKQTDKIVLYQRGLSDIIMDDIVITPEDPGPKEVASGTVEDSTDDTDKIVIKLDKPLPVRTDPYTMTLTYSGFMNTKPEGFYRGSYKNKLGATE
jgi:hypothetical protein